MSSSVIVTRSNAKKMEGETAKNVSADGRTHAEQQGCLERRKRRDATMSNEYEIGMIGMAMNS